MKNLEKDLYFVAVKVFLERKGKLFIFKDRFGTWDLPGGRLRESDFHTPLEKVVQRKIRGRNRCRHTDITLQNRTGM